MVFIAGCIAECTTVEVAFSNLSGQVEVLIGCNTEFVCAVQRTALNMTYIEALIIVECNYICIFIISDNELLLSCFLISGGVAIKILKAAVNS